MNTKMTCSRFFVLVGMVLFPAAHMYAQAGGYKVVVNPSNTLTSISKAELARIFTKKSTQFSGGSKASPVDLPVKSSARDSFSKSVLGKPAAAMDSYWQQQIFSGKDVPPPIRDEDAAISFVRSSANGIAYVSATADTAGLNVITVAE
jgi:ABC-type phosphate transport system substrate-binding protein